MENSGKSLSSECTKQTTILDNIIVKDSICKGIVLVEWCPTGEKIGYFPTKQNQGSVFRGFRDLLMGVINQTYQSDIKQGNRQKKKTRTKVIKASERKKRSKLCDRNHRCPHECVADQHMCLFLRSIQISIRLIPQLW